MHTQDGGRFSVGGPRNYERVFGVSKRRYAMGCIGASAHLQACGGEPKRLEGDSPGNLPDLDAPEPV